MNDELLPDRGWVAVNSDTGEIYIESFSPQGPEMAMARFVGGGAVGLGWLPDWIHYEAMGWRVRPVKLVFLDEEEQSK